MLVGTFFTLHNTNIFYYFSLRETTLFKKAQGLPQSWVPCNHLQWPWVMTAIKKTNKKGEMQKKKKKPFSDLVVCVYVHICVCHKAIWYLVVYLDLCECIIVSQRVHQSLHPCPGDEVGLQVQTSQRLVRPQHVAERLWGGTRKYVRTQSYKLRTELLKSLRAAPSHHSNRVVTPCCCQAELLDVRVLLHGFGEFLQRGNWNVLEKKKRHTLIGPEIYHSM